MFGATLFSNKHHQIIAAFLKDCFSGSRKSALLSVRASCSLYCLKAKVNSHSCVLHCLHCSDLWKTHLVSSPNELSTPPGTHSETGLTSNRPAQSSVSQSQAPFLLLQAGFECVLSSPHSPVFGPSTGCQRCTGRLESSTSSAQKVCGSWSETWV